MITRFLHIFHKCESPIPKWCLLCERTKIVRLFAKMLILSYRFTDSRSSQSNALLKIYQNTCCFHHSNSLVTLTDVPGKRHCFTTIGLTSRCSKMSTKQAKPPSLQLPCPLNCLYTYQRFSKQWQWDRPLTCIGAFSL